MGFFLKIQVSEKGLQRYHYIHRWNNLGNCGGLVLCSAYVEQILVEDKQAKGVILRGG